MHKDAKIYVAGHTGLVGSALIRCLTKLGHTNLIFRTSSELDLTIQADVEKFFTTEKPEYVFLAAAKVGGINANNTYPAEFIHINLAIQNNIIHSAWKHGVKRLLFLGSSCIYPKNCPQPMKEEHLLSGYLEPTNEPYAIAKIAGIKMCEAYNRQYGTQFIAVMPTNLYGPGDNFNLETSHVLPALIRKFHEAKLNNEPEVVVWGTGKAKREFLFVDDMAEGCIFVMNLDDEKVNAQFKSLPSSSSSTSSCFVNLGIGIELTVSELSDLIANVVGFTGEVVYDTSKPDGTLQKLLDISSLDSLGWQAKTQLYDGIVSTYKWFVESAG